MDVILHLGAHRTASTSFQHYMRANTARLGQAGVGFWGPQRTRDGILTGVMPADTGQLPEAQFAAARERIMQNLDHAEGRGVKHLVVSDENVVGGPRRNLREAQLYGGIGERMARYSQAFGGRITRLVLSIRSHDTYWSSVAAFAVSRGSKVPQREGLDRLINRNRKWRDVITDLACAVPEVEIQAQPYEVLGGLPERKLAAMTGLENLPTAHAREWLNRAPGLEELREILTERGEDPGRLPAGDGRWHPFDRDQTLALRESYADDLYWLRAGADGMAKIIEINEPDKAGKQPPDGDTRRGRTDGKEDRRLA